MTGCTTKENQQGRGLAPCGFDVDSCWKQGALAMSRQREIALLFEDLLHGGLSRREVIARAATFGVGAAGAVTLMLRAEEVRATQTGATAVASPVLLPEPPVAAKVPSVRDFSGREIEDPYAWLENPDDPKVIAYLEAENAYAEAVLAPMTALQDTLYEEFVTRIPQTDETVPTPIDDWLYYFRIEEGQNYHVLARREGGMDAPEEILLDMNQMAGEFLTLGYWAPSPDHRYLAYTMNETGGIDYSLYVLDTSTGEVLENVIPLADSFAWMNDNATLVYTRPDEALRPFELCVHALGEDPANDPVLYTEEDPIFSVYLFKTNDRRYIMVTSYSYGSTEERFIDADNADVVPQMLAARRDGIEVYANHGADGFLILTNEDAVNFRLMGAPEDAPGRENWTELIPGVEERLIQGLDVVEDYLSVYGRENGFSQVWIYEVASGSLEAVSFEESVYTVSPGDNRQYDTTTVQVMYTTLVTPMNVYELDLATGELTLLKQEEIHGHDPAAYVSERLFAVAEDGTEVPISLVYRADMKQDGPMPMRLDGYGSYGINSDPAFSGLRLSLIDRGMIYGIAHIRGGSELGREWWEDGKLLSKKNTFTDYIACADHLIAEGWTSPDGLIALGGSAGGMLMGAVANMAPDRFNVIIAQVPFVDVLRVMLDPTLPLTTGEFVEWGNPAEDEYYEYIKSYSPYDNVTAQDYPSMMITAGINDDQVPYWQPAKWTAKLRDMKTDDNLLLLRTNLGAGHSGESARDEFYVDTAIFYSFMLMQSGLVG